MTRVTKLACAALIALTLAGAAAYTPVQQLAGDPSQWGIESLAKKGQFDITESEDSEDLTRKVNEYEGQHFALTGDPSQWGVESLARKGSFDITELEGSDLG